ncbi:MAG: nitrate reductase [Desulfobacteraceae bacterium]|nr:MAG: nitrate reductase [Desulfobacteraceae bacterium]
MDLNLFAEGPLLWIAFLVFIVGTLIRVAQFIFVARKKDKPFYNYFSLKYILATLARWLLPLNVDVKKNPVFIPCVYLFHICLIVVPVWLGGHVSLWEESRFGWSWSSLPDKWADWMTLLLLAISIFFILRRALSPDLRIITTFADYLMIVVTALPFATGYFLTHGTLDSIAFLGDNMRLLHVLSAELMLILIPFTRLSHSVLFFFSRAAAGVEFGRRGYSI